MEEAVQNCLLLLMMCLVQGSVSQSFNFSGTVDYEPSCGLENLRGRWSVSGNVIFTEQDLAVFAPSVIIKTDTQELCTINLFTCGNPVPQNVDVCYCSDKKGDSYTIHVRRLARLNESRHILQAALKPHSIFNPIVVTSNIGKLPLVYDSRVAVNVTHQIDDLDVQSSSKVENISVCANQHVLMKVCVENLPPGSVLKMTIGDQETRSTGACVEVTRKYDFTHDNVSMAVFTYEENHDCPRTETYSWLVEEANETCKDVTPEPSCLLSELSPTFIQNTTCSKEGSSEDERALMLFPVKTPVQCDSKSDNGGWIIVQRREDGHIDFYRNWDNYTQGFGDDREFWFGLEKMYQLCNKEAPCEVRFDMEYDGTPYNSTVARVRDGKYYAIYSSFYLSPASDYYRLHISGYAGTAGDGMISGGGHPHDGMMFSTWDSDHDPDKLYNCALKKHGAWWFEECWNVDLNARWHGDGSSSLAWYPLTKDHSVSYSEIKVRPKW